MGFFSKTFKKAVKFATGGLIDHTRSTTANTVSTPTPAPELGLVDADMHNTTESESEKQQLTKGKKRGKKSLKVDLTGAGGTGRNIV